MAHRVLKRQNGANESPAPRSMILSLPLLGPLSDRGNTRADQHLPTQRSVRRSPWAAIVWRIGGTS